MTLLLAFACTSPAPPPPPPPPAALGPEDRQVCCPKLPVGGCPQGDWCVETYVSATWRSCVDQGLPAVDDAICASATPRKAGRLAHVPAAKECCTLAGAVVSELDRTACLGKGADHTWMRDAVRCGRVEPERERRVANTDSDAPAENVQAGPRARDGYFTNTGTRSPSSPTTLGGTPQ